MNLFSDLMFFRAFFLIGGASGSSGSSGLALPLFEENNFFPSNCFPHIRLGIRNPFAPLPHKEKTVSLAADTRIEIFRKPYLRRERIGFLPH